jgi:hypothetical protein
MHLEDSANLTQTNRSGTAGTARLGLGRGGPVGLPRQVLTGLALVIVATLACTAPVDRLAMLSLGQQNGSLPSWRDAAPPPPMVVQRRHTRQRIVPTVEQVIATAGVSRVLAAEVAVAGMRSIRQPERVVSILHTALPPPVA